MNAISQAVNRKGAASAAAQAAIEQKQYLTFMLGGEMFAIGILGIKEIIEYNGLTEVPMMPECIRGVINLRGAVVPVMDLSARFGRAMSTVTKRTCIIIVEIEAPPAFGSKIRTDFIEGMGKVNGKFVILLNVNQILSVEDIGVLGAVGDAAKLLAVA